MWTVPTDHAYAPGLVAVEAVTLKGSRREIGQQPHTASTAEVVELVRAWNAAGRAIGAPPL